LRELCCAPVSAMLSLVSGDLDVDTVVCGAVGGLFHGLQMKHFGLEEVINV
jgi:hypothetical protein